MNTSFSRLCLLPRGSAVKSSEYGKIGKKTQNISAEGDERMVAEDSDEDDFAVEPPPGASGGDAMDEDPSLQEDTDARMELPMRAEAARNFALGGKTVVKVENNRTPTQAILLRGLGEERTDYGRRVTAREKLADNGAMIVAWRTSFLVNMEYKRQTYQELKDKEEQALEDLKQVTIKEQKWLINASNATPYMVKKEVKQKDQDDDAYDPSAHKDGKKGKQREAAVQPIKEPENPPQPESKMEPGDSNWSVFETLKDPLLSKLRIVKTFEQILEAIEDRLSGPEPHYSHSEQVKEERSLESAKQASGSKDAPPPKKGKEPAASTTSSKRQGAVKEKNTRNRTFKSYPHMEARYWDDDSIWFMRDQLVDALDRLSDFSGQPTIVESVCEIVLAFINNPIVVQQKFMNFMITGEAGTGKTTIASYIADVFVAAGLFVRQGYREVGRTDFVAGYEGQTAQKTLDFLITNLDYGVVFLDEAYALTKWHEGRPEAYGDEAVSGIVQFLTKYKGLTCMITAGYEKEMKRYFLPTNPGLSRRIPYQFAIRNYTAPELIQILKRKELELLNYGKVDGYPMPKRLSDESDADHFFTPFAMQLLEFTIKNGMEYKEEGMSRNDTFDASTNQYYPYERFRRPTNRFLYEIFKNQAGAMANLAEAEIVPLISTRVSYKSIVPERNILNIKQQIAMNFMSQLPGQKINGTDERRPPLTTQDMADCIVKRLERTFLSEADDAVNQFAGLTNNLKAMLVAREEEEETRARLEAEEQAKRPPTPAGPSQAQPTPPTERAQNRRRSSRTSDASEGPAKRRAM